MKTGRILAAISTPLALLLAQTVLWAQEQEGIQEAQPDPVEQIILGNRLAAGVEDSALSGAGGEFLFKQAAQARIVVIGEAHLTREIPRLAQALALSLRPHGYGVLAIETGPSGAELLTEELTGAEDLTPLKETLHRFPLTLPFFNKVEEAELVRRSLAQGYQVWGLDQEFLASDRYLLDRLLELAPDEEAAAYVRELQALAMEGAQAYIATQSADNVFYNAATPEQFEQLRSKMSGAGEEAAKIVDEMEATAHIYRLFRSGKNYQSNYDRIRLMKQHLNEGFRLIYQGVDTPRILMKFGSVHGARGYSALNQLDIGNQAAELAALMGGDSLHLQVIGARYDREGQVIEVGQRAPHLKVFFDNLLESQLTVFDLRPLRPYFHRKSNRQGYEQLNDLVWGYDLLAVYPTLHSAQDLNPNPLAGAND
ncbi:MAG TPA: hypothetical protein VLU25_03715 [Acidobacteriota bacterium]|nr:hypothetical protein [Acidobacteriota bacterium]